MAARSWAETTTEALRAADLSRAIAVLPVAATEQHGPHLPLGTDAMILEGYLARALPLVPEALDVLVLPLQAVGASREHESFPGTLSLHPAEALAAWTRIGAGVAKAGIPKLVIANAHGGNVPVLDTLARDLRLAHGTLVVPASFARFGDPEGLFDAAEVAHGIHGGEVETSIMLALRPELVRMDLARDFRPRSLEMEGELTWLRAGRPVGFGWLAEDLHPSGAMGNAAAATREKGEAALAHGARAFADLLADVARFDLHHGEGTA